MSEQQEVKRASTKTTLAMGMVEASVSLYKTSGKESATTWEKASPDGNPFAAEVYLNGEPVVEEPPAPDPFAEQVVADVATPETVGVDAETGDVFDLADTRQGIRKEDGTFVDLTDLIAEAEEDSRLEQLSIVGFIRREVVPRSRIVGSYYVGADDVSAAGVLAVVDGAMRREERVAIVRWTKRKGQTLGVMAPDRSGALIVYEMVFGEYFRVPNTNCLIHKEAKVAESVIDKAADLIAAMSVGVAELDEIRDGRAEREEGLIEAALAGELDDYVAVKPEGGGLMADLEDLLRESAAK